MIRSIQIKLKTVLAGIIILLTVITGAVAYWQFTETAQFGEGDTANLLKDQYAYQYRELRKAGNYEKATDSPAAREYEERITADPLLGYPPRERLNAAIERIKAFKANSNLSAGGNSAVNINWQSAGPNNAGGRTRAIMWDPNDVSGKKVWAGMTNGGIWYTNDIFSNSEANPSWTPVGDLFANLRIYSLDYDKQNTQVFYAGAQPGIFKSTDGGASWSPLAAAGSYYVTELVVHPATGHVYAVGPKADALSGSAVYRSTNGGSSWETVLEAPSIYFSVDNDIIVAADNSLYAAMKEDGIYRSVSGNAGTWTKLNTGTNGFPDTGVRRIVLAAASNANVVYALESSGLYRSDNNGVTWQQKALPPYIGTYASNYAMALQVTPGKANEVWAGMFEMYRSADGGNSWNTSGGGWDYQILSFQPGSATTAIVGSDVGMALSTTIGTNYSFQPRNNGYATLEFYSAAMHPTAGDPFMLGSAQDQGMMRINWNSNKGIAEPLQFGDGIASFIDANDPNVMMIARQYVSIYRNINGKNGGFSSYSYIDAGSGGQFINPADYDHDANTYYFARNENSLGRIRNMTAATVDVAPINGVNFGKTPDMVRVSPHNPASSTVFVGVFDFSTQKARIYKITNAQTNSPVTTEITGDLNINGYPSNIEFGASDNELLLTTTSYGVPTVWYSGNGGQNWVNKKSNLPDMPVWWALFNPDNRSQVLLGTDVGVWGTDNFTAASPNWQPANTGLPNVRVRKLLYRSSDKTVMAVTYGRGLFKGQFATGSAGTPDIAVTPASLSYGTIGVNQNSPLNVVVKNNGNATLNVSGTSLTGNNAADYSISSGGGVFTLAPNATRTVTVTFKPLSTGVKSAALRIASNDPDTGTLDVALSGTGGTAQIAANPTSLGYGLIAVNQSSSKIVEIKNNGNINLVVSNSSLVGTNVADFTVTAGGGGFTLAPNATRNITVSFKPLSAGNKSAALRLTSNATGNATFDVSLSGSGTAASPDIRVSPSTITSTLGTNQSGSVSLTIFNDASGVGSGNLNWSVAVQGANILPTVNTAWLTATPQPVEQLSAEENLRRKARPEVIMGAAVVVGAGGPDAFGYKWIDSDESGGPSYSWQDISTIGTQLTLADKDEGWSEVNLPFTFPFYGVDNTTVKIAANGFLSFGAIPGSNWENKAIPNAADPSNFIAPFWDDLDLSFKGAIHSYHDSNANRFIVQYTDVPIYQGTFDTGFTFQVILSPNGEILMQYNNLVGNTNSTTVGVENAGGSVGLPVVYNAAYLKNQHAVRIQPPLPPACGWLSSSPTNGTVSPGNNAAISVGLNASGLSEGLYECNLIITSNDPDESPLFVPVKLTVGNSAQQTVIVPVTGWYTILSMPVAMPDSSVGAVYPNHVPDPNITTHFTRGVGYWISHPTTQNVSITGTPINTLTLNLFAGTNNLIAGPTCDIQVSAINDPNNIIQEVWENSLTGGWVQTTVMKPGRAYYVTASQAGTISMNCSGTRFQANDHLRILRSQILSESPGLVISDALGMKQRLHFSVDFEQYDNMPNPKLPSLDMLPSGLFDARFRGGYGATSGTEATIDIQAAAYPLTISAENLPFFREGGIYIEELIGENVLARHELQEGRSVTISNHLVKTLRLGQTGSEVPEQFQVMQNFPNPFNPTTEIRYILPENSSVSVTIFNALGQEIRKLFAGKQEAGIHSVVWDGNNEMGQPASSGIYLFRINTGKHQVTRKMILMK